MVNLMLNQDLVEFTTMSVSEQHLFFILNLSDTDMMVNLLNLDLIAYPLFVKQIL